MSFDKTKAMRNAERYVSQGKIRAAIGEYKLVVDADPRDIGTMNMLGDLYSKNADKREAVDCYLKVAEHYSTQGFAQKAIAVYNKISRIQPDSIEVSTKLAELYALKGSLHEARSHYQTLAEHYEKNGRRIEALSMWKQIALLDPNNTEVCMSLADSYLREKQNDEALEAYAEAGARFARKGSHEEAIKAFSKGLEIRSSDLRLLGGLVEANSAIGRVGKAVSYLEEILENEPYNRDVLYLLIDCHLDANNAVEAEKAVIKLVEMEPANYPKLLDLIRIYLNSSDLDSAARILSMSSEYLLAAGQSDECKRWIGEILDRNSTHLAGLRLLVRHAAWVKEEAAYAHALDRLSKAAHDQHSVEDERFALAHLTILRPHETELRDRLATINEEHGFDEAVVDAELIKAQFEVEPEETEAAIVAEPAVESSPEVVEAVEPVAVERNGSVGELPESGTSKYLKEIESIEFYVDNDYHELAEKALNELSAEFGERDEIVALRGRMNGSAPATAEAATSEATVVNEARAFSIDEMRSEFGLESDETPADDDFDTHYHTAVAYQEMGLYEQAIAEFQDAAKLISASDGTRRFFQCATLLGHCFIANGTANHAVTWFNRALETPNLDDSEKQGIWYELALAHEAEGNIENSAKLLETIYAENVDYRDVAERVKNLMVAH
ncbi:MAG TPA: tetratricopeptide repeat protein [Pyrinomonadaceae bacterium]|nr:tetratricopeptide repeat protein [Pyrinomonadaceae bacterium]